MTLVSIKLDGLRRGDAAALVSPAACPFCCFDLAAIRGDYGILVLGSMGRSTSFSGFEVNSKAAYFLAILSGDSGALLDLRRKESLLLNPNPVKVWTGIRGDCVREARCACLSDNVALDRQ